MKPLGEVGLGRGAGRAGRRSFGMRARKATVEQVRAGILALLPPDGTPVPNGNMASMVARFIGLPVGLELFYEARERLVGSGVAGATRGTVGEIFREVQGAQAGRAEMPWAESELMRPLERYLGGPFKQSLDAGNGVVVVQNTSAHGRGGAWSRPDFVVVCAAKLSLAPGFRFDVHAFELKAEGGGGVLAVHEALAQTRSAHYGHLVWHLPEASSHEAKLDATLRQCAEHGVGLVRMLSPTRAHEDGCQVLLFPRLKPTPPAAVDSFLVTRLPESAQARIRSVTGPCP